MVTAVNQHCWDCGDLFFSRSWLNSYCPKCSAKRLLAHRPWTSNRSAPLSTQSNIDRDLLRYIKHGRPYDPAEEV